MSEQLVNNIQSVLQKGSIKRSRDVATFLNVSEMEVVLSGEFGEAFRIELTAREFFEKYAEQCGPVRTIVRNNDCVHELFGTFPKCHFPAPVVAMVLGPEIDMRMFLSSWKHCVFVTNSSNGNMGLHFYDASGCAILKVIQSEDSNVEVFESLKSKSISTDGNPLKLEALKKNSSHEKASVDNVVAQEFLEKWKALKDTHDFVHLVNEYNLHRLDALHCAHEHKTEVDGALLVESIPLQALRTTFEQARDQNVPIMIFTGNDGAVQIFTGTIERVVEARGWLNILDKSFHFHLVEDAIASAWIVRKPTTDGIVTSVEVFNAAGDLLCTVFGERKPGIPELDTWRSLAGELSQIPS